MIPFIVLEQAKLIYGEKKMRTVGDRFDGGGAGRNFLGRWKCSRAALFDMQATSHVDHYCFYF